MFLHDNRGVFMNFKISDAERHQQNINQYLISANSTSEEASAKYYSISATVHAALILVISLFVVPVVEKIKTETITIEITDNQVQQVSRGKNVPATQGGSREFLQPQFTKNKSTSIARTPAKSLNVNSNPRSATPIEMPKEVIAKEARIDDLEDSDVENSLNNISQTQIRNLNEQDVDEDFEKVNRQIRSHNAKSREMLTQDFDDEAASTDELVKQVGVENQRHSIAREKLRQAMLQKDSNAIERAKENEKRAAMAAIAAARKAEAAQQAEAARLAQAKARAEQRQAAIAAANGARNGSSGYGSANGGQTDQNGLHHGGANSSNSGSGPIGSGGDGQGFAKGSGNGAGNNGLNQPGSELAGNPKGVRSLEQLRQMPGNPKPQYSQDERLSGQQGKVAYLAYVDAAGRLSRFKQIQSTGYVNLDRKTLEALKKWRFYPGQQGWVELPLKWELKGGAQETRSILRANNSQPQYR